jgi:sulfatase modifying factor 1
MNRFTASLFALCLAGFAAGTSPALSRLNTGSPSLQRVRSAFAVASPIAAVPTSAAMSPSDALASPPETPPPEAVGTCPEGMVEVEGEYCPNVAQYCQRYADGKLERDRCAEFRPNSECQGPTQRMRYCIDRYEYPNRAGDKPVVAVSWIEAGELCAAEGKRLCGAEEWTLACEGPERLPFPYGYKRDSESCNIDKPYIVPNDNALANPKTHDAEFKRVDQREPSGERGACVSPYGVYDMTGNVDEWVFNRDGSQDARPFDSGLKGGYWGPVRDRCRPMTVDHNKWHSGYQIGFRCCADLRDKPPAPAAASASDTLRGS